MILVLFMAAPSATALLPVGPVAMLVLTFALL